MRTRPRVRWPGRAALGAGILTPLAVIVALFAVPYGSFAVATIASWGAIGGSALAVLGGLVAAIGNWGRAPGIAAIMIGVLTNPVVLLYGLNALGNF